MYAIDLIRYATPEMDLQAYVGRPKTSGEFPAIVLLHSHVGFDDALFAIMRRFLHEGFVVMTPDLYRHGCVSPADEVEADRWASSLSAGQIHAEVQRAVAWLRNQGYTRSHSLGVVGLGRNARNALWAATIQPLPPAAVIAIGGNAAALPEHLSEVKAPVAGFFAQNVETTTLAAAMRTAGQEFTLHTLSVDPVSLLDEPGLADHSELAREMWSDIVHYLHDKLSAGWH